MCNDFLKYHVEPEKHSTQYKLIKVKENNRCIFKNAYTVNCLERRGLMHQQLTIDALLLFLSWLEFNCCLSKTQIKSDIELGLLGATLCQINALWVAISNLNTPAWDSYSYNCDGDTAHLKFHPFIPGLAIVGTSCVSWFWIVQKNSLKSSATH